MKHGLKLKRAFDIMLSLVLLGCLWWLIAASWIVATIDTRANGFFRQERVGLGGRSFRVLKIRTMRNLGTKMTTVTVENDPRVTPIGRFFRATKLDELPQVVNVLGGSMSLVGPRPTVKEDYERMTRCQRRRNSVRPGITGLAQVSGNTELSWNQRIEYDLFYIDNWSFWLDIRLLGRTLSLIVSGKASTHPRSNDEWGGS